MPAWRKPGRCERSTVLGLSSRVMSSDGDPDFPEILPEVLPEVIGSEQEKVKILAGEIEKLPAYQWLLGGLGMLP